MSNYRGNDISINGDGNAVGDNNRLTIIKNERHHHDHRPQPSRSGDGSSDDVRPLVFGLMFAMISACVAGSYFFALHAQEVYSILQLVSGAELLVALWLVYATLEEEGMLDGKLVVMVVLSTISSAALFAAHVDYRDELTALAKASTSATQFWCRMTDYGRELALFHAVTAVVGFGLGSLLLAFPTGAMTAARFMEGMNQGKGRAVINQLSSWGIIVLGTVLVLGAAYLHTEGGRDTWSNAFGHPPSFFCGGTAAGAR